MSGFDWKPMLMVGVSTLMVLFDAFLVYWLRKQGRRWAAALFFCLGLVWIVVLGYDIHRFRGFSPPLTASLAPAESGH